MLFSRALGLFPKRAIESQLFRDTLYRSLENLTVGRGRRSESWALNVIARLSGGIHDMSLGRPLYFPLNNTTGGYCLAKAVEVYPYEDDCESFTLLVQFLTGPLSSSTKTYATSLRTLQQINRLAKTAGIMGTWAPSYERIHPSHLVGCFMFVNMIEEDGYSKMADIGTSGTLKSRNKKLEDTRKPREIEEFCGSTDDCAFCPFGVEGQRTCSRAVRPFTLSLGDCCVTKEHDRWINPLRLETSSLEYQKIMWQ